MIIIGNKNGGWVRNLEHVGRTRNANNKKSIPLYYLLEKYMIPEVLKMGISKCYSVWDNPVVGIKKRKTMTCLKAWQVFQPIRMLGYILDHMTHESGFLKLSIPAPI